MVLVPVRRLAAVFNGAYLHLRFVEVRLASSVLVSLCAPLNRVYDMSML